MSITANGSPANLPALPSDLETGLEDLKASDLRIPRLTINHDNGTFKDSLSNVESPELVVVTLGFVRQRVLWPPTIPDGNDEKPPLCKSVDSKVGYPTVTQRDPRENFPWQATGWQPTDFKADSEGRLELPCDTCRLKEWNTHPVDGRKTWCSEQHSVPLMYGLPGMEPYMTAIFTTQRSSIRSSQLYFANIARRGQTAYSVMARLTLQQQQRGKNTFYVPVFQEIGPSDQENWSNYSDAYRSVREYLMRKPMVKDADGNVVAGQLQQSNSTGFGNNTWAPGQPQQAPQQYQPQQAPQQAPPQQYPQPQYQTQPPQQYQPQPPQPAVIQGQVQDPWGQPVQQQDPWPTNQQVPPVQQPVQQAAPQPAPVPQVAPQPAPVPQVAPMMVPPVQIAEPAPAMAATRGGDDTDDLPF